MVSMIFYPLQRQVRGDGAVTDDECHDVLLEVLNMQSEIERLRAAVQDQGAEAFRTVYEPYPGAFDHILGKSPAPQATPARAAANAIGNIAHAEAMTTVTHPLYLHRNGIETEYTATWDITTTRVPAEPYSWGGERPDDIEASARLVSYENGNRDDAVAEGGEAAVVRQEQYVAECGLED